MNFLKLKENSSKHLLYVNESYFEHFRNSLVYSFIFFKLSICCVIHGLMPCFFQNTGSEGARRIFEDCNKRKKRGEK